MESEGKMVNWSRQPKTRDEGGGWILGAGGKTNAGFAFFSLQNFPTVSLYLCICL